MTRESLLTGMTGYAVRFHRVPSLLGTVLGISQHHLEPDAQAVDLFDQWFEIDLVVLVAWGDGEGEGHLRVGAAGGVHPVSEDKASPAPAHSGVGVAQAGPGVPAPLAVGLDVGAVHGDDLSLHHPGLKQLSEQVVEDLEVGLLSHAVSEMGEEAVARRLLPESAGPCGPSVVA